MSDTTTLDLDAIEARASAATAGPWAWNGDGQMTAPYGGAVDSSADVDYSDDGEWDYAGGFAFRRIIETDNGFYPPREHDRDFIAAARTDVPALVAEVRRLRGARVAAFKLLARDYLRSDGQPYTETPASVIEALSILTDTDDATLAALEARA